MLLQVGDESHPKVLIVDDEPQVLQSLADQLRREFRVLATTDADTALELLRRENVSVIVTDQRMPSVTGTELLARAAALRPDTVRVLLTAYSDIEAVIRAVNDGHVYQYVSKPWNPEGLNELLRTASRQYGLVAENRRLVEDLARLGGEVASAREDAAALRKGQATLEQENQTLREVYEKLKGSFWHLKKIQEVLPICMECGKVKVATASWEPVVEYLRKNSLFLSHGYCPECSERVMARFREDARDESLNGS